MHISVTPKQAPSDDEYPFVGTPTPHRTPQLATARRRQRQQFSAVKAVPPPLTPQWLPRVFAHADEHGDKATASNLTSSLVPSDEAITTWQQYTQQVGDVLFSFFSALHRRGFTCPATQFPPTSFVTALGTSHWQPKPKSMSLYPGSKSHGTTQSRTFSPLTFPCR